MSVRLALALALAVISGVATDAIPPLDLKPGLWQTTLTVRTTGMPPMPPELAQKLTPEQRWRIDAKAKESSAQSPKVTVTTKCFEEDDLTRTLLLTFGSDRQGCTQSAASPSRNVREIRLKCGDGVVRSTGTVRMEATTRDAFTVTSEWFATDSSRRLTISSSAAGKWLGASCDVKAAPPPPRPGVAEGTHDAAPHDAAYYDRLGREQVQQNKFREALATLDQAVALDPERATARNARGYAHMRLGDYTAALADFDEAIRLRPVYPNAYQNRAVARRHLGDAKGAVEDEAKAMGR